jgi:hypothetical protein
MKSKKKSQADLPNMPFEEAIARFLHKNPVVVADELARVKARQEEIQKDAEQRKKFIEHAGRPSGKRFRL